MTDRVKTVAMLTARAGKAEELRALLEAMIAPSREEPGNLGYDLWADPSGPGRFVLDELYADAEALAAHRESAHFRDYLSRIEALAERTVLRLEPRIVA